MPPIDSETLDHPVGSPDGDAHRTTPPLTTDADETSADRAAPPAPSTLAGLPTLLVLLVLPKLLAMPMLKEHSSDASADDDDDDTPESSVSTVPPDVGPSHGETAADDSETTSKCTPLDVYSRPFVLTSTSAYPARDALVLHTSADALTYAAASALELKRQRSAPADSADAEKPLPSTVTRVPPSDTPRDGHTDDTESAGRYVNATPHDENCWPFIDTSTSRAPEPDDRGDAHSS